MQRLELLVEGLTHLRHPRRWILSHQLELDQQAELNLRPVLRVRLPLEHLQCPRSLVELGLHRPSFYVTPFRIFILNFKYRLP
jgi:hypothetical protein